MSTSEEVRKLRESLAKLQEENTQLISRNLQMSEQLNVWYELRQRVNWLKEELDSNQRMTLTNALIYAQASNVLARARAGADFSELADEFSQDEGMEPGGDLGFCAGDDFALESPMYWENIVCLKPGEITDVMESDEGIEIVKFLGEKEDVYGDGSKFERHLARIVWHTAIIFDTDENFIRKEMEKERKNDVIKAAVAELQKKAKIVYPHGEDIVISARKRKRK